MAHPFHIHGALFRVFSIAGAPPPHLTGWKDVILVEDKAELLVAFNQPATRVHRSCIIATSLSMRKPD
jgi:blue copper oxidase